MSVRNVQDVQEMINALYPLIYIVSYEEKRVLQILKGVLAQRDFGHEFLVWSQDLGLCDIEGKKIDGTNGADLTDPLTILEHIKNTPEEKNQNYVFVLKDFDPFMNDSLVQRHLRTISEESYIHITVIILSPVINIPQRLSKSIQIVEWSLPTKDERDKIINYDKKGKKLPSDSRERDKINKAMAGLTEQEAVNAIARQAAIDKTQLVGIDLLNREKLAIVKKNPVLDIYEPKEYDKFDSLGGWDVAKAFIRERSRCFSEEALAFGVEPPKGVLIFGVPGCGKTQFAKCVGHEYGLPVVKLSIANVMAQSGGIVGQAENWIKEGFSTIEAVAPCIVFMDEIEKGASGMESSGQSDAGMTSRTLSIFLEKLEERNAPFFVVATANRVSALPPEMVRPGRWDTIMFAGLPTTEEREQIFRVHLDKRGFPSKDFDVSMLAKQTDAYTGAELEQIVKDSVVTAFNTQGKLTNNILADSCQKMTPQSKFKKDQIQALIRWAESNGAKQVSSKEADGEVQVLQLVTEEEEKDD